MAATCAWDSAHCDTLTLLAELLVCLLPILGYWASVSQLAALGGGSLSVDLASLLVPVLWTWPLSPFLSEFQWSWPLSVSGAASLSGAGLSLSRSLSPRPQSLSPPQYSLSVPSVDLSLSVPLSTVSQSFQ